MRKDKSHKPLAMRLLMNQIKGVSKKVQGGRFGFFLYGQENLGEKGGLEFFHKNPY